MNQRERMTQLYSAISKTNEIYEAWAKKNGLSYIEMTLFYDLAEYEGEPVTQKQLCVDLVLSKTTVNSVVKKYIKMGYLELQSIPDNKKEKWVALTAQGRKFVDQLIMPLFHLEEEIISTISDEQLNQAENTLNLYSQQLEERLLK